MVVDLNNCANGKATEWWHDTLPEFGLDFWEQVDDWFFNALEG